VVEVALLVTYIRGGVASAMPELAHAQTLAGKDGGKDQGKDGTGHDDGSADGDDVLAFAY
jgi:cytochrome d ubiquinol oxidase subunit I